MWQKNNGKSETEMLQNLFTAYLTTAVRRRRNDYIKQAVRIQQMEGMTEDIPYNQDQRAERNQRTGAICILCKGTG